MYKLSSVICSSKSEYITTAAAPASSSLRIASRPRDSGDAEGTIGFFSFRPMYSVLRSIVIALLYRERSRLECGELRVLMPPVEHGFLSLFEQRPCGCRITLLKDPISSLGIDVVLEELGGRFGVQLEGISSFHGEIRVVTI